MYKKKRLSSWEEDGLEWGFLGGFGKGEDGYCQKTLYTYLNLPMEKKGTILQSEVPLLNLEVTKYLEIVKRF